MKAQKVKMGEAGPVIDCDWVSVTYHQGLGTVVYLYTSDKPTNVICLFGEDKLVFVG